MIKLTLIVGETDYSGRSYVLARQQMGSPHHIAMARKWMAWRLGGLAAYGGRIMRCDLLLFCRHPSFLTQIAEP